MSIDENIVGYPKQMEKGTFASQPNGFTNHHSWATQQAYSYAQVDETLFCIVKTKYLLFSKKSLRTNHTMARKEFDWFEVFFNDERVRSDKNYISFPNSREFVDYTPLIFHLICKRVSIFLDVFEFWIEKACSKIVEVY